MMEKQSPNEWDGILGNTSSIPSIDVQNLTVFKNDFEIKRKEHDFEFELMD